MAPALHFGAPPFEDVCDVKVSTVRWLALIASIPLTACGSTASTDSNPDGSVDPTVGAEAAAAYTTWRAEANRASCERKLRCESPAPFPSVDDCLAHTDPDVLAAAPRIADSIREGRTRFFSDDAAACIAKYEISCEAPYTDILAVCNKAYDGQQPLGADCVGHFECVNPDGPARLLCFEGCASLFGYEDTVGSGQCVEARPPGCTP